MAYQSSFISEELICLTCAHADFYPSDRLGIEGLITFKSQIEYDADSYRITAPSPTGKRTITVFGIKVKTFVEKDRSTQKGNVRMDLACMKLFIFWRK